MLKTVPIRWRLAAAFAVSMAVLLVTLGAFVYFRVDAALRSSVDEALRAQAAESQAHREEGSLLDADARRSETVVQVLGRDGRILRSDPASLQARVVAHVSGQGPGTRRLTVVDKQAPGETECSPAQVDHVGVTGRTFERHVR